MDETIQFETTLQEIKETLLTVIKNIIDTT
jgi:hypothetical protein